METTEVLTTEAFEKRKGKPPVMRISNGRLIFSVEAVNLLGLKEGDRIKFVLDKSDNEIVYFKKDNNGWPLMVDFSGLNGVRLRICCRPLAAKILSFLSFSQSKTFTIKKETADYYGEQMWFFLKDGIHKPIKWRR